VKRLADVNAAEERSIIWLAERRREEKRKYSEETEIYHL